MPGYYGIAPTPPRVAELWPLVVDRLDTATLGDSLGGTGRVFRIDEDGASEPVGTEMDVWGRVVIAPVRRAFGEPLSEPGRSRIVPFLVRVDIHAPPGSTNFDPLVALEATQNEAFARLHGWTPTGLTQASIDRPIWRHTDPQSAPLWDSATGVWYTSAEFRAWLAPA